MNTRMDLVTDHKQSHNSSMLKWSDAELYQYCKKWGLHIRQGQRKFVAALPEVYRRRLYKRRGCASIHEFAAKLAGMSQETVNRVLRLSKKLEDKPTLKAQFESGNHGWTKMETVAYIATPETDKDWAKKVETMPKLALETYVKENRLEVVPGGEIQPEKFTSLTFKLKPAVEFKLRQMKQQLEKQKGETMSFGEVLEALLEEGGLNTTQAKKIVQICADCTAKKAKEVEKTGNITETIPTAVKRVVLARQEDKCPYPRCNRPPDIFHHTRRQSLRPGHDPDFIVALCKAHERLVHCGLIGNEEKAPSEWFIREWPDEEDLKIVIDERVNSYRREPMGTWL